MHVNAPGTLTFAYVQIPSCMFIGRRVFLSGKFICLFYFIMYVQKMLKFLGILNSENKPAGVYRDGSHYNAYNSIKPCNCGINILLHQY